MIELVLLLSRFLMETEIQEHGYAFEWRYGSILHRIYMRSKGVNITNEIQEANVRDGGK